MRPAPAAPSFDGRLAARCSPRSPGPSSGTGDYRGEVIFTTAYTSTMVRPLSDPELVDLLVESRARNADRGITGLLLYRRGRVMQMLEGEERVVRDLYDRIAMDVRHEHVTNVWSSIAVRRRFPDWTMGFEDLDETARSIPAGHSLEGLGELHGLEGEGWDPSELRISDEQADLVRRRSAVLRRALSTGDRLVGALAIILNGHDPEPTVSSDGQAYLQCRVCRTHDEPTLDAYPCATAKNALWALEATGPR
ncbi:Sensors of blue-light using FAD [Microlunatus sagamiharensis]|uniref:Sensors of blue-light using FAD n=1 Tax=Microlunatus sagamiharensis TaxID=546874 RepID=A0A1H2MGV5_9ACTN|nr:Sensors of blue-light using FAD [Microlunatus sagamiharensis]